MVHRCGECGAESPRWLGRCPECGAWGALVETVVTRARGAAPLAAPGAGPAPSTPVSIDTVPAAAAAIDPTGKFLVATGEKSENVSVYAIDGATGALKPVAKAPVGKGANWVEIVRFD